MRLPSIGASLALFLGVSVAGSNVTASQSSQKILQGDFQPEPVFENTNLVRTINLEKGYVRETTNVQITNVAKSPQSEYYIPFGYDLAGKLGGFDARDKKHAERGPLEVTQAALASLEDAAGVGTKPTQYYIVHFPEPIQPKDSVTLTFSYHVLGLLRPLPASISQDEKQYLTYDFSALVPTVYKTLKQKTKLKLPSSDVPEYTTTTDLTSSADPEKQGSQFNYGPYDTAKITPGTLHPVSVRYEFNKPLLTCSLLERDIEVSHWGGNLATEERYWLRHDGASLKDHFSRVAWSTQSYFINSGQMTTSALRQLNVPLKAGSVDPYFTDDIGNVSTSRFRPNALREASLELKPRYPLFGGWKYSFKIGWNNDLSSALRKLKTPSNSYILNVPLMEGPKSPEGVAYETLVFRVLLPEGATNVKYQVIGDASIPEFHVEQGLYRTFMDSLGRTELKLTASNVIDEARDVSVLVTYEYPWTAGLRKPLTWVVGTMGVFVMAWLLSMVDTSIGKKKAAP